jgi:anti-sigma regulatory factor (Ser/Thr protein kinase)
MTLGPQPASVREARRYVGAQLADAGFDGATFVAELLVSELVTNALLHARTTMQVSVEPQGDLVRIAVADGSALVPQRRAHSVESGTGRGLLLVEKMASRWGVDSSDAGKVVWFELPRHPEADIDLWGDLQQA